MASVLVEQHGAPTAGNDESSPPPAPPPRIRGVNLGGWLVMERFIVPYMFAITDCHLRGDHCCFPGQLSAPQSNTRQHNNGEDHRRADDDDDDTTTTSNTTPPFASCELCDLYACSPARSLQEASQSVDYPLDEYTLGHAFLSAHQGRDGLYRNKAGLAAAESWLNMHFETFIARHDLERLVDFGITHVRVPLPHWILGGVTEDEPWIIGQRWTAFTRVCRWARTLGLQVWPDLHTAPGSQNGFDNSGQSLGQVSCHGWLDHPAHVERSLDAIRNVTARIVADGLDDVITGFGLLNEPFKDCDATRYRAFVDAGLTIVRDVMGDDTAVYIGDMFLAETFNDGTWGLDADRYRNTYLDSHYYQVFSEHERALSPRQHIAYTCQKKRIDANSCCYHRTPRPWYNPWKTTKPVPSRGVQRLFGEWSVAYDILPTSQLAIVMDGIATHGQAPMFDRTLTPSQMNFMKRYAEAQMVMYESVESGVGWFYWNIKMEGGAFAEWDFLRGVAEGWIPELPGPTQSSEQAYGTCYDIIFKTYNDADITANMLPDPNHLPPGDWLGDPIDDDVVLTDGASLLKKDGIHHRQRYGTGDDDDDESTTLLAAFRWTFVWLGAALLVLAFRRRLRWLSNSAKTSGYSTIRSVE